MTEYTSFWDGFNQLFAGGGIPLCISLIASGVRYLRTGFKTVRYHIASLSTSIFVGQIVFWFAIHHELDVFYTAALVGVCAYGSNTLIDAAIHRLRREVGEGSLSRHKEKGHE